MTSNMRTVIDVPDKLIESLDQLGGAAQTSRAALIREAIVEFLRHKAVPQAEAAFGLWRQRQKDGLRYQTEVRGEWDNR
jgi:predicted transcriptional regulator